MDKRKLILKKVSIAYSRSLKSGINKLEIFDLQKNERKYTTQKLASKLRELYKDIELLDKLLACSMIVLSEQHKLSKSEDSEHNNTLYSELHQISSHVELMNEDSAKELLNNTIDNFEQKYAKTLKLITATLYNK